MALEWEQENAWRRVARDPDNSGKPVGRVGLVTETDTSGGQHTSWLAWRGDSRYRGVLDARFTSANAAMAAVERLGPIV
jgi:hypothetical protein